MELQKTIKIVGKGPLTSNFNPAIDFCNGGSTFN